jgi:hypothetical protein
MTYSAKDHRLHLTISDGSYMVPMAQSASLAGPFRAASAQGTLWHAT